MSHLGERVTALVDGQLPVEAAQRAARHLSDCPDCRQAVEVERLMKYRLIGLGVPEPGTDLLRQLLTLAGPSGPLPPRTGHVPGSPRPALISIGRPAADTPIRPPSRQDSWLRPMALPTVRVSRSSRNRVAAAVVGAACLVGAGAGVAGGVASAGVSAGGALARGALSSPRAARATYDTFMINASATFGGEVPVGEQSVLRGRVLPPAHR